ncbi:MAG: hypothetical protein M5R36_24725 [Deltaproteobacteria bacterium]|nr:hypothetical protein [Deltaproteobacteria bacterium]
MAQSVVAPPHVTRRPAILDDTRYYPATHGAIHAIVDASTVMALFTTIFLHDLSGVQRFHLVLAYNVLAFGGQGIIGVAVDRFRFARWAPAIGLVLSAVGVALVSVDPVVTVALVGTGNAFFHVGAGALSLHAAPGRATPPGIFVAPGALGLLVGTLMGKGQTAMTWPFLVALGAALVFTLAARAPDIPPLDAAPRVKIPSAVLIFALLMFSIFTRSFVGFGGCYECPKMTAVSLTLAFAAFGGKALGGVFADRLGWIASSVGALLLSAPLIVLGSGNANLVIFGLFLFQMTMPVTLAAMAAVFPGRPAFAFGLSCVAYVAGTIPTFFRAVRETIYGPYIFLFLILASAAAIFVSLKMLEKRVTMRF